MYRKSDWQAVPLAEVYKVLDSNAVGLSHDEAGKRLTEFGPNTLPETPPPVWWELLIRQFYSPLIYILLVAAFISILTGELRDAGFIVFVLLLNAMVGGYQEWKAEKSSQALRKLLRIRASVERGNELQEIPAEELVPGDVVWLESGNRIPADLRLIMARGLEIDESLLTGESLPVLKDPGWIGTEDSPQADQANMAFAGAIVTHGRATGIVVATGSTTAVGQLALDVSRASGGKLPLLSRMEQFTNVIALSTLAIAAVIGTIGGLFARYPATEMFIFVVVLAVAAIPEGLPVAMTVALAVATTRMARRGVIVRRLTAVEGLGSCTFIATDKTGTLTVNELTVREIQLVTGETFTVTGEGFVPRGEIIAQHDTSEEIDTPKLMPLIRSVVLCNEADLHQRNGSWHWRGDAVDVSLLVLGHKYDVTRESMLTKFPQVNDIPYESERQFAASFNQMDEDVRVIVKGAPERVLQMCREDTNRDQIEQTARNMAERGLRVLAIAEGPADDDLDYTQVPSEPKELELQGFVGMIDPLRPGVREAVDTCHRCGVSVSMITGDHSVTALAIARDLGLAQHDTQVITGPELVSKTPDELAQIVQTTRVFARVAPRQKLQIVEAAQLSGHFVAVTGDGVNDAPALQAANIGVAMGQSGTDVAREASELVISDDNFATIVVGIEEGRVAYDNIRKVIYLLISTGAAELLVMGLAVVTGMPLPLLPVQVLWMNLVTNGIQDVALAFEPGEGDVLDRKPRSPQERIFDRLMIERTLVAAGVMGAIGFGTFYWMIANGYSEHDSRNVLLLMMVLFENFHIGNCRSETKSAFYLNPLRSPFLLAGAVGAFLIHLAAMYIPFMQSILDTSPVSWTTWLIVAGLSVIIVPTIELHKWLWNGYSEPSTKLG